MISSDLQKVLDLLCQATIDAEKINAAGVQIVIVDRHGAAFVFCYLSDEINSLPSSKVLN